MPIKKHDFVELEYTGKVKETGEVFDSTDEKTAKDADIYSEGSEYAPVVICIGENHILKGLDTFLEGKEPGTYNVELSAEDAFGKKDAKLMRMIPTSKFKDQEIRPVVGLRLNIDGAIGIVRTVTGGRTVVDFNHPLSGKEVVYDIKVNKIVTDKKIQVESLLKTLLGLKNVPVSVEEKKASAEFPAPLPDEMTKELKKKITELTGLEVEITTKKAPEAKEEAAEKNSEKEEKAE